VTPKVSAILRPLRGDQHHSDALEGAPWWRAMGFTHSTGMSVSSCCPNYYQGDCISIMLGEGHPETRSDL
jgi:hypothetical protein